MPKTVEPIVVQNVTNFDELTKLIKTFSSTLNSISRKLQVDDKLLEEIAEKREKERFQRSKDTFVFTEWERDEFLEKVIGDAKDDIPSHFAIEAETRYTEFHYVLEKVPDIEKKVTEILQTAYDNVLNLLPPVEILPPVEKRKKSKGSFAIRRSKFKNEEESNSEPEVDKS